MTYQIKIRIIVTNENGHKVIDLTEDRYVGDELLEVINNPPH